MSVALTSKEEIEALFSSEGVENHLEDIVDNDLVIDQIVVQASETCLLYLRTQYSEESCAENPWVRQQATYIACYFLSIRRGNPSLYTDLYAQALVYLEQVRDGELNPGIPSKPRAVVQTPMLDSRFIQPKRVNTTASTRVYPRQNLPRYPWLN